MNNGIISWDGSTGGQSKLGDWLREFGFYIRFDLSTNAVTL